MYIVYNNYARSTCKIYDNIEKLIYRIDMLKFKHLAYMSWISNYWIRGVILTKKNSEITSYITGEKYSLLSIKTIKKFKLNVTKDYINLICANGKVDILAYISEFALKSGIKLEYDDGALDEASKNGHVNVLEWWLNSGLELKYTKYALDIASMNGHVNVLDWWLKTSEESNLVLKYDEWALDWACMYGHVDVLDWWLKSGLELKYSEKALNFASYNGHINVLEWWLKSSKEFGLRLIYNEHALNYASEMGHVNVLEWWLKLGLKLKYSK